MKFIFHLRHIIILSILISSSAFSDIEQERTNSVGRSDGSWETGLQVPSDDQANDECNIVAGLPFSCTLPTSGGGTVICNPVSIPGGVTLSSSCVLAGSSPNDFSIDVEFNDGVSDPVTKTVNLTAGPNQSPSASDPIACSTPKSGFAWSCDVASSVSDPEGQTLTYALATSAPSWASMSGSTISGTPDSSGNVAVPYTISDGVNIITYTYNISITAGTTEVILGDDPVSSELLADAGLSNSYLSALSGTGCGTDGTSSCLDAYNANKGSTACTLAGGSSATASQITDHINCVIIEEGAVVVAANVPDSLSQTSATNGCEVSDNVSQNISLPSSCGHSSRNCVISGLPSDWTANNGSHGYPISISIPGTTTTSGTVNLSVAVTLAPFGDYAGGYVWKTMAVPVNVATAISGAVNGRKNFTLNGDENWFSAWNSCSNKGGILAERANTDTSEHSHFRLNGQTEISTRNGKVGSMGSAWNCINFNGDYTPSSTYNGNDAIHCNNSYYGNKICAWDGTNSGQCYGHNDTVNYTCENLPSCN
jgi:hypothetical protein